MRRITSLHAACGLAALAALGATLSVAGAKESNGDRPPIASAVRHLMVTPSSAARATRERPRACRRREVATLVRAFVGAFNVGAPGVLGRLVAHEPEFHWYSTAPPGARLGPAAQDRASLATYFARRRAQGEQLLLSRLKINGNSRPPRGIPPYGNFEYDLTRQADDLEPTPYSGKGAAYCYTQRADSIIVWSMGPSAASSLRTAKHR